MLVLVAYDVAEDKRRRKMFQRLKNYGDPRLKSVFECWARESAIKRLQQDLGELLEPGEDSVRCYLLCEECEQRIAAQTRRPAGHAGAVIV